MDYNELKEAAKRISVEMTVTQGEMGRIGKGLGNLIMGVGFLDILRKTPGLTLDSLLEVALNQPHNEEHHEMMKKTRNFFVEHAAEFGLQDRI